MKKSLYIALFMVLLSYSSARAMICSEESFHQKFKTAAIVFSGKVLLDECLENTAVFEVTKMFKGAPTKNVIMNNKNGCSYWKREDKEHLFFANLLSGKEFDKETGEPVKKYTFRRCSGSHHHNENQEIEAYKFVNEIHDIDKALSENKDPYYLKVRARNLLYWHDFERAELVLNQILDIEPDNVWAILEIFRSLYEQNKPKRIWEMFLTDERLHKAAKLDYHTNLGIEVVEYVDYAKFVLGSDYIQETLSDITVPDWDKEKRYFLSQGEARPMVQNVYITGLPLKNTTVLFNGIHHSDFVSVDFSGSKLIGGLVVEGRFVSSDFTDTDFTNIGLRNSEIVHSKLEGANLENTELTWNVSLDKSTYNCKTKWPKGFDPEAAGAINVDKSCE